MGGAERGRLRPQYIQSAGAVACCSGAQVGAGAAAAGLPAGTGQHNCG